jgi:RNA polymerase sigma factor (sigma-70 family)
MSMQGPSDEALLAGMAQGDDASAVAFVRRYQKRLFGLAMAMIGDAGVAEDVAQEAMVRVWRHAPVFDARRGSVTSWVLTITRNLAIDALRLRRALPTDPDDFVGLGLISTEGLPEESAATGDVDPGLRTALADLPSEQRRAVVLAAVYGRTAAEISVSESIPLGTAKTRIRAGMGKLRAALPATRAAEGNRP